MADGVFSKEDIEDMYVYGELGDKMLGELSKDQLLEYLTYYINKDIEQHFRKDGSDEEVIEKVVYAYVGGRKAYFKELKAKLDVHYLHPDKKDTVEELTQATRIFGKALGLILKTKEGMGEGVIVELDGKKYQVYTTGKRIEVGITEAQSKEGTLLWVHFE